MRSLTAAQESWPIAGRFTMSRASKTEAEVVVAEIRQGDARGRGECTPYDRYGQTPVSVLEQIEAVRPQIEAGCDRAQLQTLLPAGSARCALDCALWDLEAQLTGVPAWRTAGLSRLDPVKTVFTLSLGSPEEMAEAARKAARRPMLKLKIGRADDLDRVQAVREAAPLSRLIVDANEALTIEDLKLLAPEFAKLDVKLIEQPLEAGADEALMLDDAGYVASCNATNFFFVRGGRAHTSSGRSCFNGITRSKVIALCQPAGIPLAVGDFTLLDVYGAEEAFVTGTFGGVTPVRAIDGRMLPQPLPGPVTRRLASAYAALVDAGGAIGG